jgi:hypothetical protein
MLPRALFYTYPQNFLPKLRAHLLPRIQAVPEGEVKTHQEKHFCSVTLWELSNFPECLRVSQSISECLRVSQSVSEYLRVSQSVLEQLIFINQFKYKKYIKHLLNYHIVLYAYIFCQLLTKNDEQESRTLSVVHV